MEGETNRFGSREEYEAELNRMLSQQLVDTSDLKEYDELLDEYIRFCDSEKTV